MLRLVARFEDQIWSLSLEGSAEVRIGSAEDNDLVLPVPGISRRHAKLVSGPEGSRLVDLGSKNSLLLAGRRYRELVLKPGLKVQIGKAVLALEEVASSDAELALTLPQSERPPAKRFRVVETEALSEEPLGSPGAAMSLLRRLSSPKKAEWGDHHGREALEILGARSLLFLYVDSGGEVILAQWSGPLPEDGRMEELGRLARRAGAGETDWFRLEDASGCLLGCGSAEPRACLVASFPAGAPRPKRWRWELFRFLAQLHDIGEERVEPRPEAAAERTALRPPPGMVVGESPSMRELMRRIRASVKSRLDVLLLGETGTGKEVVSRLIHCSGPTRDGPFVAINCAAIPAELLEAELFGIARGAATGVEQRPGHFLRAEGGTLLLDEIGEMPAALQAKLLRVVEEREVLPVGGAEPVPVNVRMISTTNRDLERRVQDGSFRSDLYYRLCGHQFVLPPLRERKEDIPRLALHFASLAAAAYGKRIQGISRRALKILLACDWPGNVRQLRTEVERAVLLCPSGGSLEGDHFLGLSDGRTEQAPAETPTEQAAGRPASGDPAAAESGFPRGGKLHERLERVEREAIEEALEEAGGNKTRAAKRLGITRHGLSMKMARLGIEPPARR